MSSGELSSIAATVSAVVMMAITVSGRPKRMVWAIVPTSRVTRVTRSPELALSTRPSGSASTVRTTYSRAAASTSWPKTAEVRRARKIITAWTTTTPATASASPFRVAANVPGAAAWSTRPPRIRGTISPAIAARACSTSSTVTATLRRRTRSAKKRPTSLRSATGSARSGRRDSAK